VEVAEADEADTSLRRRRGRRGGDHRSRRGERCDNHQRADPHPQPHASRSRAPIAPHSHGLRHGSGRRLRIRARDVLEMVNNGCFVMIGVGPSTWIYSGRFHQLAEVGVVALVFALRLTARQRPASLPATGETYAIHRSSIASCH
jgi:hypothetical protein